ncbi:MAG: hypothetical protein AB7O97_22210 [Planctomycetota bacterium]
MRRPNRSLSWLVPFALLVGCGEKGHGHRASVSTARPVSILVEVYHPVTDEVWENVGVRVVEAYQEWSDCTCVSPYDDWYLTDFTGQVLIDEFVLADAAVGFVEDRHGGAVLGSRSFENSAMVTLQIDALGHDTVFVDVPLTFDQPDVFVAVPFE